jgi:hypothetical protein
LTVEAGTLDVVVIYIKNLSYFCSEALHATTSPQLKAPGLTSQ